MTTLSYESEDTEPKAQRLYAINGTTPAHECQASLRAPAACSNVSTFV